MSLLLLYPSISASRDLSPDTRSHTRERISRLLFWRWPSTYKSYWKWSHCHTVPDTTHTHTALDRFSPEVRFCEGESAELDKKRGSIQYFLHLVGVSGQKAACRRSSVCSDLSKPIRISYSRGDMYSNILWKIFIPRETLTHKVMFKPFVCPVLLIPLGLLPLRCPGPVYIYARIHAQTHTHTPETPTKTHSLTDMHTGSHTRSRPTAAAGGPHC